jgi:hypothetical protein
MQTFNLLKTLQLWAGPILFSAAALGIATVHMTVERKAERARARAAQARLTEPGGEIQGRLFNFNLRDITTAADRGDLAARVEIGRRFALGLGVRRSEVRAATYFQSVIKELGELNARDKRTPYLATAYRYMARFYRKGVAEANIPANPTYSFSMLHHAASYLGDAAAQFELGTTLLDGEGVAQNHKAAAQWFLSASRKGYAPAQAKLGELLWHGNGIKRVAGDGLGLLALARQNAAAEDKAWIGKMFESARSEATASEILEANAFIVQETSSPRFGSVANVVVDGYGAGSQMPQNGAAAEPAVVPRMDQRQSSLIQAPLPELPELTRNPLGLAPNPIDPELVSEPDDANSSAGILQMYQPAEPEHRSELNSPVRFAGVSRQ